MDSPLGSRHQTRVDAVKARQLSRHPGSSALNVGWKVVATIFSDYKGVLLVDYLLQKTAMTGPYYGEVLTKQLRQAVKERRRKLLTRGPLLQHDNAPAHMSRIAQAIRLEQLSHPPYSPDLTPSDFYLFRLLKQHLCGTRFLMMMSCSRPWSRISTTCPRNTI